MHLFFYYLALFTCVLVITFNYVLHINLNLHSETNRLQMYGARPIRRWLQKNVMTKLSEMLIKGEIDAASAVSIDATVDKKALRYEVTKRAALPPPPPPPLQQHQQTEVPRAGRPCVVDLLDDDDDDDDVVEIIRVAKKAKPGELSAEPASDERSSASAFD